MNKYFLALCTACLIAGMAPADAWYSRNLYPQYQTLPSWQGGNLPAPDRTGYGSRIGIHIEKDIYEQGYLVRVYTRGIRPEDIEVTALHGRIQLRNAVETRQKWQNQLRRSSASIYSRFVRTIPLPRAADPTNLAIMVKDNLLEIRIPRRGNLQP